MARQVLPAGHARLPAFKFAAGQARARTRGALTWTPACTRWHWLRAHALAASLSLSCLFWTHGALINFTLHGANKCIQFVCALLLKLSQSVQTSTCALPPLCQRISRLPMARTRCILLLSVLGLAHRCGIAVHCSTRPAPVHPRSFCRGTTRLRAWPGLPAPAPAAGAGTVLPRWQAAAHVTRAPAHRNAPELGAGVVGSGFAPPPSLPPRASRPRQSRPRPAAAAPPRCMPARLAHRPAPCPRALPPPRTAATAAPIFVPP